MTRTGPAFRSLKPIAAGSIAAAGSIDAQRASPAAAAPSIEVESIVGSVVASCPASAPVAAPSIVAAVINQERQRRRRCQRRCQRRRASSRSLRSTPHTHGQDAPLHSEVDRKDRTRL